MSLLTADYDYYLPETLIAREPATKRDASRMLVLDRASGSIAHRTFSDLPKFLRPGDLALLNDTRVIPARLFSDDARVELLLLEPLSPTSWKCFVKPGRRMREGATATFAGIPARVASVLDEGERIIEFQSPPDLDRIGHMPLPPYIKRPDTPEDRERYQTVYARSAGAIAAPTAGLHFTPEILARIPHTFITLHVGPGTFKPVSSERITDHAMHAERYVVSETAAAAINAASRVLAVGTTSVRTLETAASEDGIVAPGEGETSVFIHPGYRFKRTGALLTNFHLPKSTLIMLVSAFAGRETVLEAYRQAVRECYRFYSYGDCMLIL